MHTESNGSGLPREEAHAIDRRIHKTPMFLINEISKLFVNELRFEEQDISNSYRPLLFHLARRDGRTQLELSQLCHLKPPTVSVTLKKMEEDGYVTRQKDTNDLRQTRVYLTEKGRAHDEKIQKRIDLLEQRFTEVLTAQEQAELTALLTRLLDCVFDPQWEEE